MINIRAIARGFLVDLSSTCLFAVALSVVLLDPGSSNQALADRLSSTEMIDWLCLIGGLGMTALGAFVAARMTPGREMTHAGAVGGLSLLAGFLTSSGMCPFQDWFLLTGLALTLPAAQCGGAMAALYHLRRRIST